MRSRLAVLMTLLLVLGFPGAGVAVAQTDIPHPPQFGPTPTPTADGGGGGGGGGESSATCAAIPSYYRELNRAFMAADVLGTFLSDGANYEELTAKTAAPIVEDADTLIQKIEALDVPAVYADGNKGIAMLIGLIRDQVAFYGLDSTRVPKVTVAEEAYQLIYDGETATAEACPREIDDVGGYIFIDPATIKDQVNPGT
ncbi:MAG: hypothetical protein WBA46_08845 [Thermomicrobiales bacterium]